MNVATRRPSQATQSSDPEAIEFSCSECDRWIRVATQLAGERGLCPKCLEPIRVPERSQRRSRSKRLGAARAHKALPPRPTPEADEAPEPPRTVPPPGRPPGSFAATTMGVLSGLALCCKLLYVFA